MFLSPSDGFFGKIFCGIGSGAPIDGKPAERILFLWGHLSVPQRLQLFQTNIANLPRPFPVGDVFTDRRDVAVSFFRFPRQQFPRLLVNLLVPFGKLFHQLRRDALDFKVTTPPVLDLITKFYQGAGQFVVIDIFNELLRPEHFVILKCFPLFLDGIERGIEQNAVAVQGRVQGAGSFMPEHGRHDVAGWPVGTLTGLAHARCGESFQLMQCHRHRLLVSLDDAVVIAGQCRNGNRFGR